MTALCSFENLTEQPPVLLVANNFNVGENSSRRSPREHTYLLIKTSEYNDGFLPALSCSYHGGKKKEIEISGEVSKRGGSRGNRTTRCQRTKVRTITKKILKRYCSTKNEELRTISKRFNSIFGCTRFNK